MNGVMVVIGTNDLDEYYEMDTVPVMGDKVVCKFLENKVGGMLANAAAVYAGYGCKTYMIDCVNGGPQSKIMERELRECGVDTSYFSVDASLPDPRCLIMLKGGERVIFVMDRKKRDLKLTADQGRLIAEADIVYSSLSELRAFGAEEHITERIVASGAKLALDVEAGTLAEPEKDFLLLGWADYLFINSGSHRRLSELYGGDYGERLREMGAVLVYTKGSRGCSVCAGDGEPIRVPGYKVEAVDTTGAGDTFNASFLYGVSRGWTLRECAEFANAAAARAIGFMGARGGVATEAAVKQFKEQFLTGGNQL